MRLPRPSTSPKKQQFQSTHPLRGATSFTNLNTFIDRISIHAPLAGCDEKHFTTLHTNIYFNPRTPCGVRLFSIRCLNTSFLFQSTHPLRGATSKISQVMFSPRFQSTHPLRGATEVERLYKAGLYISIHAPLAGCDDLRAKREAEKLNFNPRTPCGVRRHNSRYIDSYFEFQSTHPLRGATIGIYLMAQALEISIHAPLAGCDRRCAICASKTKNFNPRTPCGVRP